MEFKKFSAGPEAYGQSEEHKEVIYEKEVTNVKFYDENFWKDWRNINSPNY